MKNTYLNYYVMIKSQSWEFGGVVHGKMLEEVQMLRIWSEEWKGLSSQIIMIAMDFNKVRGEWYELRSAK